MARDLVTKIQRDDDDVVSVDVFKRGEQGRGPIASAAYVRTESGLRAAVHLKTMLPPESGTFETSPEDEPPDTVRDVVKASGES